MTEPQMRGSREILSILRRLEGVAFAGQLGRPVSAAASCSCQNCGCDSRVGDFCGCDPKCSCQGYTAFDRMDKVLDPLLGVAAALPIEDVKTLVGMRDKLVSMRDKMETPSKK